VLDVIAISVAIVGLRAGQFRSYLMRERPKTIQRLYEEFEKIVDQTMTSGCVWKSSLTKRSLLKLISQRKRMATEKYACKHSVFAKSESIRAISG
jgi:hypothetical protein